MTGPVYRPFSSPITFNIPLRHVQQSEILLSGHFGWAPFFDLIPNSIFLTLKI